MPTKRPREVIEPENLPANLEPEEACPAIYTAQGLYDKRPGDYAKCVQMLAQGQTITRIKKDLKISHNTIAVVRAREQEVIDASKKVMRGLIRAELATLKDEKIVEAEVSDVDPPVLHSSE